VRRLSSSLLVIAIVACLAPVRSFTSDFPDFAEPPVQPRLKWPTKTIKISLSTSLSSSVTAITPDSDVIGAVQRALGRWSQASHLKFETVTSRIQSVSPTSGGDGISLITVADTSENLAIFNGGLNPARTRVFFDSDTGEISEADIAINSLPLSAEGVPLQFSTDGTPGTYDLESTITHEIGHLLGLDHSNVLGATMQARQCVNGTYKLPAFTERTLSEDDRARINGLYETADVGSAIEGRLINNLVAGSSTPVPGAHVWVEDSLSGRVIASALTTSGGNYRIESVPPGQYRLLTEFVDGQRAFRSAEISSSLQVNAKTTSTVNFVMVPPQNSLPVLKPRLIGTNGELSTTPVPVEAGKRFTIHVAGEGVDQVPISGISITSPFVTIDNESLRLPQFRSTLPVISFDVHVAPHAPFGDYSVRLQSNSGEVAYLAGGITIDPGVSVNVPGPADDSGFFISQLYRDFLGRDPDQLQMKSWLDELDRCGSDQECSRARRLDVSAKFLQTEIQETWSFIYRLYKAGLGRRPALADFNSDRIQIARNGSNREDFKRAFARAFVERPEFLKKYSSSLKADQFVDLLLSSVGKVVRTELAGERDSLKVIYDGTSASRAEILQRVASQTTFAKTEDGQALVLMQYFGFLRREPEEGNYNSLVNSLTGSAVSDASAHRAMACHFINSAEYQSRFGMFVTRTNKECQF